MTDAVQLMIDPRIRDLGGFSVRCILPFPTHGNVGPFVVFDHLGPAVFTPGHGRRCALAPAYRAGSRAFGRFDLALGLEAVSLPAT